MSGRKAFGLQKICITAGCLLLAAAMLMLAVWQISLHMAAAKSERDVQTILQLIPEPQAAVPEPRSNNTMAALPVDGTDYIGLLSFPRYDSVLPVRADWNKRLPSPCRYDGSVYDGSLIIGGSNQKGQYTFWPEISAGDVLYFTDMTGNRYTYEVTDIRYREHADDRTLRSTEADLTLFIKNIYASEYIIVYCSTPA